MNDKERAAITERLDADCKGAAMLYIATKRDESDVPTREAKAFMAGAEWVMGRMPGFFLEVAASVERGERDE